MDGLALLIPSNDVLGESNLYARHQRRKERDCSRATRTQVETVRTRSNIQGNTHTHVRAHNQNQNKAAKMKQLDDHTPRLLLLPACPAQGQSPRLLFQLVQCVPRVAHIHLGHGGSQTGRRGRSTCCQCLCLRSCAIFLCACLYPASSRK